MIVPISIFELAFFKLTVRISKGIFLYWYDRCEELGVRHALLLVLVLKFQGLGSR